MNKRNFQCDSCDSKFKKKYHLIEHHQLVHSVLRQFKCDLCQKDFKLKKCLQRHIRTVHSDQKNLLCDTCGQNFTRIDKLKDHLKVHNYDNVHKCLGCEKAFIKSGNWKRHVKICKQLNKQSEVEMMVAPETNKIDANNNDSLISDDSLIMVHDNIKKW